MQSTSWETLDWKKHRLVRLHRRQPNKLLSPWNSPGKNTGVGCHFRVNYFPFAFSPFQGFVHWLLFDLLYFIFLMKWILFCIFYFYKIQLSCVKLCISKIYQDFTFPIHIWQQKTSCRAILAFVNAVLYWCFSSAMFVMNWMITDCLRLICRSSIR